MSGQIFRGFIFFSSLGAASIISKITLLYRLFSKMDPNSPVVRIFKAYFQRYFIFVPKKLLRDYFRIIECDFNCLVNFFLVKFFFKGIFIYKFEGESIFICLCLSIFKALSLIKFKLIYFFGENDGQSLCQIERVFYIVACLICVVHSNSSFMQ